jgi:hypothetical protein
VLAWPVAAFAEDERYKVTALAKRDARLREFAAAGWRPVDIQRVTGYSRETIRQALKPEARADANRVRGKTAQPPRLLATGPPADYVPYGERRPYVVAEILEELTGPTVGVVTLPGHLDWSGRPIYNLDEPGRLASMYRTVLTDAATVDDLRTWLNRNRLIEEWPDMYLPAKVRRLWEDRFPSWPTPARRRLLRPQGYR